MLDAVEVWLIVRQLIGTKVHVWAHHCTKPYLMPIFLFVYLKNFIGFRGSPQESMGFSPQQQHGGSPNRSFNQQQSGMPQRGQRNRRTRRPQFRYN